MVFARSTGSFSRIARTAALYLVIGVFLNVAVAWWSLNTSPRGIPLSGIHAVKPEWPRPAPIGWPACYHAVLSETASHEEMWAYSTPGTDHEMRTIACGRPFRSFGAWSFDQNDGKGERWSHLLETGVTLDRDQVRLPWHPLWPGFFLNTVLFGTASWALMQVPAAMLRRSRLNRGCCTNCNYNLAGLASNVSCPECGLPRMGKPNKRPT